ncbi:MAG: chitobiase/beta-hexosaminidase C-terminal domain-containing protein [Lachnospiraceae bacterium]|nr:chitobiase/beta-hexosaminidase C-terminal domain-containing protein [Lachnospiraceae bacterium]
MQCPKCGSEIPEGKLYCPKCGYAVQIVPDYDASLEENLDSVGSDIAGNVNRIDVAEKNAAEFDEDSTTREIPMVKKDEVSDIVRQTAEDDERREKIMTLVVAGLFVILVGIIAVTASRSMGRGSFVPQRAVDRVVSDNTALSVSGSAAAMDIAGDKQETDPGEAVSEDTVSEDTVSMDELIGELIVEPEPGKYNKPQNITAKIFFEDAESVEDVEDAFSGIIYYTDDGTEPDESSTVYKHEFPMPMGHSSYAFRFLDSRGNLSDTIYVEYDFNYEGACSPVDAANIIIATLINDGALLDIYGHVPGSTGMYTYKCTFMVNSGNRNYFMIPEYYEEPGSAKRETGTVYAVDAETLGTFKVKQNSDGQYNFEMFF